MVLKVSGRTPYSTFLRPFCGILTIELFIMMHWCLPCVTVFDALDRGRPQGTVWSEKEDS